MATKKQIKIINHDRFSLNTLQPISDAITINFMSPISSWKFRLEKKVTFILWNNGSYYCADKKVSNKNENKKKRKKNKKIRIGTFKVLNLKCKFKASSHLTSPIKLTPLCKECRPDFLSAGTAYLFVQLYRFLHWRRPDTWVGSASQSFDSRRGENWTPWHQSLTTTIKCNVFIAWSLSTHKWKKKSVCLFVCLSLYLNIYLSVFWPRPLHVRSRVCAVLHSPLSYRQSQDREELSVVLLRHFRSGGTQCQHRQLWRHNMATFLVDKLWQWVRMDSKAIWRGFELSFQGKRSCVMC